MVQKWRGACPPPLGHSLIEIVGGPYCKAHGPCWAESGRRGRGVVT